VRTTLDILDLAPGGEGTATCEGRPCFVPFAAPGDRVEVEVQGGAGAAHAGLTRILEPGPGRVRPPCPHFGPAFQGEEDRLCGGCEWMHLDYGIQLAQKERALAEALRRIGRLEPGSYRLHPTVPSPRPLRYRSRAKFHLDRQSALLVFFRRRSHVPVRLRECQLLVPGLDELREAVGPALARARLWPREVQLEWTEHARKGSALLRFPGVGETERRRAEEVLRDVAALSGLVLEGDGDGRAKPSPLLVGEPVLLAERVPGAPERGLARTRPDVFQQANRFANARLVALALDLLRPDGEEVLELFCGAGNFTGALAERARSVAAVEGQGPALELARADLAGRPVRFFSGDALALAGALAREGRRYGAVLLDPPREGMKGLGPLLRDLAAPRAVYVSCDPATFARDVKAAVGSGYRLEEVVPVDMFPQTHHVECIALLERNA